MPIQKGIQAPAETNVAKIFKPSFTFGLILNPQSMEVVGLALFLARKTL